MLHPQIIQKPPLKLIGLEIPFIHGLSPQTNNFKVIPPLWESFSRRADEVPNRASHAMYGIIYGKPKAQRSHPDELQYIAAVAVNEVGEIPPGMVSHIIPATTYAVFIHRGPIGKIRDTVFEIYRVWLPKSGYEQADFPDVELYDDRFCGGGDDSEMEYWIAIKPGPVSG